MLSEPHPPRPTGPPSVPNDTPLRTIHVEGGVLTDGTDWNHLEEVPQARDTPVYLPSLCAPLTNSPSSPPANSPPARSGGTETAIIRQPACLLLRSPPTSPTHIPSTCGNPPESPSPCRP